MKLNKLILITLLCLLLLPLDVFAITYGKVGESTNFNGDVNIPNGSNYYINGVALALVQCRNDATGAPTTTDDSTEGYEINSIWTDITNDKSYVCVDDTEDNAVWVETTGAGGGYTNLTSFVDQTAWRLFYSNTDGDVTELALGADGTFLQSNGASAVPTFETGSDVTNWVIPQDYATGTGTSEDPWAGSCIEDAYTACPTGGTIFLRAGYYQLAGLLTIAKQINIIGEGINKTIVRTADAHGFTIDEVDYVTIKNLTIDSDAQTDAESYKCGIAVWVSDYVLLENIEIKNGIDLGIDANTMNHSSFLNIYSHDNLSHGIHAGTDISGNDMYNTYRDIYAWDNTSGGFDDIGNEGSPNEDLYNIYDNIHCWDNGGHGIVVFAQRGGAISNCSASGNTANGLYLNDLENFNIHDCFLTLNGVAGLYMRYSDNVNFTNVIVKNNAVEGSTFGITVRDSDGTRFTSCQSYDDRGGGALQSYGLFTEGTIDYITLINCKLLPNVDGAINNYAVAEIYIDLPPTAISDLPDVTSADADYMLIWDATDNLMKKVDMAEVRGGAGAGALGDLTDVGDGTPTNTYAIMGDGDSWESRALVEVDISDLGTYMEDLSDDATPELTDDLDCNDKDLTEVKTVQFEGVYAIGNSGSTETIDWQNGTYQSITLDEACVISFSNEYVGTLNLLVTYGGSFALTFDGGITLLEEGGVEIVTTDAAGVDLLIFKNFGVADTYVMGALLDVKD